MMRVYQHCSICGTTCESVNEWDSLDEFYAAEVGPFDEPEFAHDEEHADCGGNCTYTMADA